MRSKFVRAAIALVGAIAFAGSALAQDIRVAIDSSFPLPLTAPATGVAVGNPGIAGVSVQNERLLFVTGRSYGSTNLVVVNGNGRVIFSGRIIVTPNESGTVTLMRGTTTQRLSCAASCRPSPDIGDDPQTYSQIQGQVTGHAGAANGAGRD